MCTGRKGVRLRKKMTHNFAKNCENFPLPSSAAGGVTACIVLAGLGSGSGNGSVNGEPINTIQRSKGLGHSYKFEHTVFASIEASRG